MIILNIVNPEDEKGKLDLDWYNYVGLPLCIGFLIFDIEQMSILSSYVKISKNMNMIEKVYAKLCGFFGNGFFTYRFIGHALYIIGITTEFLGYIIQEHVGNYGFRSLKLNIAHLNLNLHRSIPILKLDYDVDDIESHFVHYHPVRIGICLQAIALLIVTTQLLQYLCLHPVFGMVYVGLRNIIFFQLCRPVCS